MASVEEVKVILERAEDDEGLARLRTELAAYAAAIFGDVGKSLHVAGHLIGVDRVRGTSPFGNGDDETVGVANILCIASELVSASANLLSDGRPYAGAALLRQIVEVEYLAWAFANRHEDAAKWLRSDSASRQEIFRPAKLRAAAGGKFRSKDYGHHCEFGGHPTPGAFGLLHRKAASQLFISDLLGHAGRIWDHLVDWAIRRPPHGSLLLTHRTEMVKHFQAWKAADPLVDLPPP